jgi:hypothetical protein
VNELIRYLMENMYIDFQGEISTETVRNFLKDDPSREARTLLNKIVEDKGVEDMLITLADCLKDHLRSGISEEAIRDQLGTYSESLPVSPSLPSRSPGSLPAIAAIRRWTRAARGRRSPWR